MISFIFFFFSSRRRHTRCSRDWSSDVCSSDLTLDFKWLPENRGLVALYSQRGPEYFQRSQIAVIPEGADQFEPITRDTNSYATLTLSADGKTLATVQTKTIHNLYLLSMGGSQPGDASAVLPPGQSVYSFDWTADGGLAFRDRKSTRLNSSHGYISYAVFCLKKK